MKSTHTENEARALQYLKAGVAGRTYHVAWHLAIKTPSARRLLQRLEKRGEVKRSERYSAVNDIFWVLSTGAGQ